jgi:hypothetical protein
VWRDDHQPINSMRRTVGRHDYARLGPKPRAFEGLRASSDSEELRFFPRKDVLDLDLPATQRHILERYLSLVPAPRRE